MVLQQLDDEGFLCGYFVLVVFFILSSFYFLFVDFSFDFTTRLTEDIFGKFFFALNRRLEAFFIRPIFIDSVGSASWADAAEAAGVLEEKTQPSAQPVRV